MRPEARRSLCDLLFSKGGSDNSIIKNLDSEFNDHESVPVVLTGVMYIQHPSVNRLRPGISCV